MPLDTWKSTPPTLESTHYLVFFSSGTPPWCPDCVDAQPAIDEAFVKKDAAQAYMILIGEKAEWKTPENRYRKEYGLKCIPTILKVQNGKEVARLENDECKDATKLAAFVVN